MTDTAKWPSRAAQQKICKRKDVTLCALAGSLGCALCTPEQYTDQELDALKLPVALVREQQRLKSVAAEQ